MLLGVGVFSPRPLPEGLQHHDRLQSKAMSDFLGRRPRWWMWTTWAQEAATLLEQLVRKDKTVSDVSTGPPGVRSTHKVHLPVLLEWYEPLEEPPPGEKPKRRYLPS
ncbi:uncharacterized protein C1orf115-like [Lutra lutra]|uniref:uncharacterized protein C1orf115-like n=1 Tax=Lutra lutra TaxID=9657 RepID=UPI001FD02E42|nr:uncharacterized protein C1orf115-like [Lutra lutra]